MGAVRSMFDVDLPEALLDECEAHIDDWSPGFTRWELGFLDSLREHIDDGYELSDNQVDKLEEIHEKMRKGVERSDSGWTWTGSGRDNRE